jgi:predicted DNA-binding protein
MNYQITDKPHVQFPVRISHELHQKISTISKEMCINKSVLVRIGLDRLMNEIQQEGILSILNEKNQNE